MILELVRSDCSVEQRMVEDCKGRYHEVLEAVEEPKMTEMIQEEHSCLRQMKKVAVLPMFEMPWLERRPEQFQPLGEAVVVEWLFAEHRKGQLEVVQYQLVDLRMEMLRVG